MHYSTVPALAGSLRDELETLSREIHANPELAYQERKAVDAITRLVEKHGHKVERGIGGLETAFRARVGPPGKAVALLAEYDALPEVGHGCGHNLIAMSNVGAFLLAAQEAKDLKLGIELIGTPAEEKGGGKIDLLDAGVFRDTVAVLSSHPSSDPWWEFGQTSLGVTVKTVTFHGLAAHAAVSPERGRNALSAAVRLFVAIDGWRQHLPSDARVHGIITKGGAAQNIIPALAECVIGLRSADVDFLRAMERTFADMCQGAALMTGTTVEVEDEMRLYAPVKPDKAIGDLFEEEFKRRGIAAKRGGVVMGSTDLGNVSQAVPTDAISFPMMTESIAGHSHVFRESSVTDLAHRSAVTCTEVLAAGALRFARGGRERNSPEIR